MDDEFTGGEIQTSYVDDWMVRVQWRSHYSMNGTTARVTFLQSHYKYLNVTVRFPYLPSFR